MVTKKDYLGAKETIKKYQEKLRNKIKREQAKCKKETNHEDFYRYWAGHEDDNHLQNVCRNCFHEWSESYRPFLLSERYNLTHGQYAGTEQDAQNWQKHKKRLENIDNL